MKGFMSYEERDVVWFCRCAKMMKGDYCPKHGSVNEEDRIRRKRNSEAYEKVCKIAKESSWVEIYTKLASSQT